MRNLSKDSEKSFNRGKWKVRVKNIIIVIGILLIGTCLCFFFTNSYYYGGEKSRQRIYSDIFYTTFAVTQPNIKLNGGGRHNTFFTMDYFGSLKKQVGRKNQVVGDINFTFFFNRVINRSENLYIESPIVFPFRNPKNFSKKHGNYDWNKLDMLPEGTVAEVFLSFDDFYQIGDVVDIFKEKDMEPVWFVVDSGFDETNNLNLMPPIGFPQEYVSIVGNIETYIRGEIKEGDFIKLLKFLQKYEGITKKAGLWNNADLKLNERISYLKENGVNIYGAVVTGPTKEILKLKEEEWINWMRLGEVALWNWN